MSARPVIFLTVWLTSMAVLCAVAAGTTVNTSPITPGLDATEPSADKPASAVGLETDPHYTMAYAKPIFEPSRRPYRPKPAPKAEVVQTRAIAKIAIAKPTFRLLGVSGRAGALTALVQDLEHKQAQWLKTGDLLRGWRLTAVTPDSALLLCPEQSGADCKQLLSLYPER